jgi:hypothetical protein
MSLQVGDRVHWTDPDEDLCSGDGVIVSIHRSGFITVRKDDGGEVEALDHELRYV